MQRPILALAFVAVLGFFSGCGGPTPEKMYKISGSVSLDGKPLASGEITFEDSVGKAPATCTINNGQFEGTSSGGKKKVLVSSFKEEEMKLPKGVKTGPGQEAGAKSKVNFLPEKYNTATTLSAEVKQDGDKFEFKLDSK
ncbi:MAG: hypothetical protein EXR99_09600 [Gemmataceae bacterium]|nr:hypothetical protein [Gemmataceae bacterium]